jgi:GTPase SAR1 family protein
MVHVATQNKSLLNLSSEILSGAKEVADDLRTGRLRIYFFGHQNAGKSSLINTLIGRTITPEFPGKMTACLIRIRHGDKLRVVAIWQNGAEQETNLLNLQKKMTNWSESLDRPKEIIIEYPSEIFGVSTIELIDTPGTGSAWSLDSEKSFEDEIVAAELKTAALAIIVYKYSNAETESHDRLLRQLGDDNIPTYAICNLDPNWQGEYKKNSKNINKMIDAVESRSRKIAKASCYRLCVTQDPAYRELIDFVERIPDNTTLNNISKDLKKILDNKKEHIARQVVRKTNALIEDIEKKLVQFIKLNQDKFEQVEQEKSEILSGINTVRNNIAENFQSSRDGTIIGASVGSVFGLIGATTAATALTGGLYLLYAGAVGAAGAIVGYLVDQKEEDKFNMRLGNAWSELQRIISNAKIIRLPKIQGFSTNVNKGVIDNLESVVSEKLSEIPEYNAFLACRKLDRDLKDLRNILKHFLPNR